MAHGPLTRRAALVAAFVVGMVCARPRDAWAYRPFDGTDADIAEHGEFELELGPSHYYREAARNYLIAPSTVLNLGIVPRGELVVDFQDYVALDALPPGVARVHTTDTDVLFKYILREGTLQEKTGPSIAAEVGPLLPDVNGAEAFGASLDVITSYQWSFGTLHWNEWGEYTRDHDWSLFTGVILEGPHAWTVRPVVELFLEHTFDVETTYSGLAGAIWTVADSLSLDGGVRAASIGGVPAEEVRLGFTWGFPVWTPADAGDQPPAAPAGEPRSGRMTRMTGDPLGPVMSGKNTRCVSGSTATE